MAKMSRIAWATVLASALVGCGDDDPPASMAADGGSTRVVSYPALPADGSFSTGLAPARSLDSLSTAELRAICESTSNAVPLVASCPSWGLTAAYNLAFDPNYEDGGALPSDARLREACASTRGQCEDAYGAPPSSDCDVGFRSGCTGSVAQLEACINDTLAATRTLLAATPACDALSCATFPRVAQQWLEDSYAYSAKLKSCVELYDTCAGAGGTQSSQSSATPRVAEITLECAD